MNEGGSPGGPLETAADTVGPGVVDVFELLGNETRLAILLALWEAFDPYDAGNAVPFTALRKRVGVRHGEQFHYHLDRLVGDLVWKTDEGYELRDSGRRLVQTVIAGVDIEDPELASHETEIDCWVCGASTEASYRNQRVYTTCTECEGTLRVAETEGVDGTISAFSFSPAGLVGRTPDEMVAASIFRGMQQYVMRMGNLCPVCDGPVDSWFDVCETHDREPDALCEACGRQWEVECRWLCRVCKHWGVSPPSSVAILHPRAVAFYQSHGIDIGYPIGRTDRVPRFWELMTAQKQELVSGDSPRVRVTISHAGEELRLTFDESMRLLEADEGG